MLWDLQSGAKDHGVRSAQSWGGCDSTYDMRKVRNVDVEEITGTIKVLQRLGFILE